MVTRSIVSLILAFYCYTGEVIQTGDSLARLTALDCKPRISYGEQYYLEHWIYQGKNGLDYEVTINRGEVVSIENKDLR